MSRTEKITKRVVNELSLLSIYLVILKAFGWLTLGWLFALAPLLAVMAAKTVAITILIIEYLSYRRKYGKKTGNQ